MGQHCTHVLMMRQHPVQFCDKTSDELLTPNGPNRRPIQAWSVLHEPTEAHDKLPDRAARWFRLVTCSSVATLFLVQSANDAGRRQGGSVRHRGIAD